MTMEQGTFEQQIAWSREHMPRLKLGLRRLPDMTGVRLACSMHLDLKMIPFVDGLLAKGAELFITTCNPATVRDQVVAVMRDNGARVEAWRDMPAEAYHAATIEALRWGPTHLCEMGADLSYELLRNEALSSLRSGVRASVEATGSGINRLEELDLPYPVFNWDDLPIKEGLHNRHMVGLTTWQTFFERTHLTLHEKQVLVIGYGSVGQGIARVARAYGGTVTIVEKDPARAIEARYDGWPARSLEDAIGQADVIVTATGATAVISAEHLPMLKDGVFLLNCGHHNAEIDVAALRAYPAEEVLPHIEALTIGEALAIGQKRVYLLAGGSMFNLTAGQGDSLNAFDVTLATLVSAIGHIVGPGADWSPGIHLLPRQVWEKVI
jgi:adenosylhomocysteinase